MSRRLPPGVARARAGIIWASLAVLTTGFAPYQRQNCRLWERLAEIIALRELRASTPGLAAGFTPPPGIDTITVRTFDGRDLGGYRVRCEPSAVSGVLLVAQGDAVLAGDSLLLAELKRLCGPVRDIYVFDYRGTGRSREAGGDRLADVVQDYRVLHDTLRARHGAATPLSLYGVSGGGVVLLNAIPAGGYARLVLDGVPARLPVGCWNRLHNPVARVPGDARALVLITAGHDKQVALEKHGALAERVARGGGTVHHVPDLEHFTLDPGRLRSRFALVESLLGAQ